MPAGALRAVAFLLFSAAAFAQMNCTFSAVNPDQTFLRAEGIAERTADARIVCMGGTPTAAGGNIPVYDISVGVVNGRMTPRLLSAASPPATEVLALLDEPLAANQFACTDPSGTCPGIGNGVGSGYYGGGVKTPAAPNNRNVFQGLLGNTNVVQFRIPIDPPGPGGQRIVRFTNIRINASEFGLAGGTATVSLGIGAVSNATPLPINGPFIVPAGTIAPAMTGSVRNAANTAPLGQFTVNTSLAASELRVATIRFLETQQTAFRSRTEESGVMNGSFGTAGAASHGTRLIARFQDVPPEARLFVQASGDLIGGAPLSGVESVTGAVRLIQTDTNGNGPFNPAGIGSLVEIFQTNGERLAVWEVTAADGAFLKRADLAVYASFAAGVNWTAPTTVNMTLGPVSGAFMPSSSEAIPRFVPRGTGPCIYTLSSSTRDVPLEGGTADTAITTLPQCPWSAFSGVPWIQVVNAFAGTGGGHIQLRASFNPGAPRSGQVLIGDKLFTINQAGGFASMAMPTVLTPAPNQVIPVRGVSFTWNPVSGATGYEMRVVDASTGSLVFSGSLAGGNATSMLGDLPAGIHDFHVRACAGGFGNNFCGPFSPVRFQVFLAAPLSNPAITAPTPNQVLTGSTTEFRWQAVAGASSYLVQVFGALAVPVYQVSVPAPATSTIYTMRGGALRLRVSACAAACNTIDNSVAFTASLPAAPTGAPAIISAAVSSSTLNATWTSIPGADIYILQVVQPTGGPGGGALTVGSARTASAAASLPIPAGAASIFVAACNGNGCGPYGSPTPVNAPGPNPPAPVLSVPIPGTEVQGPAVNFSWSRIPGDNGSNTTYRLFVADLSTGRTAFDVHTADNFAPALLLAAGRRYDAVVAANPGPSQLLGPATGFVILGGDPSRPPALVAPAHRSQVKQGNVQLGWAEGAGFSLYQYYVAVTGQSQPAATGVSAGFLVQVPLVAISGAPTSYTGIVRGCKAQTCLADSDAGWTPWSNAAGGPGVTTFTVIP